MDVTINGKLYRNIEALTTGKLEHLAMLADHQVVNHERCYTHFDDEMKKRPNVAQHHQNLLTIKATIEGLIHDRVDW